MAGVQDLKNVMTGNFGSYLGSSSDLVTNVGLFRRSVVVPFPIDGATGDGKLLVLFTESPIRIVNAKIFPGIAVTAHDTNYQTIALFYDDGAGGADTSIITAITTKITGGTGNWTAQTAIPLTLLAAGVNVAQGKYVTCTYTHASSGVVIGPSSLHLTYDIVGTTQT